MHDHLHGAAPAASVPATDLAASAGPTAGAELLKGIWRENPVLVQLLGLCPALAVTNSVANALAMGIASIFVLVGSSVLISSLRKVIPGEVRISSYILIIATFVTLADMALEAMVPTVHKALGAFIALIVVNCIILGRQEAFSSKNSVGRSFLDALGMGGGFMIALLTLGTIRELLGSGTLLGISVFGPGFEPWVIMVLPPGGFLTMGAVLLAIAWWRERRTPTARPAPVTTVVVPPHPHTTTVTQPAREPAGVA